MLYYFTVGKRKTQIVLTSLTRCSEVKQMFRHRFGHVVSSTEATMHKPVRSEQQLRRAIKVLDLVL